MPTPTYQLIATAVPDTNTYTFTSIPQTYTHLFGVVWLELDGSGSVDLLMRAGTTGTYNSQKMHGTSPTETNWFTLAADTAYGDPRITFTLFDYSSTNKHKSLLSFAYAPNVGTDGGMPIMGPEFFSSKLSLNTAITELTFSQADLASSRISLYGVIG